MGSTVRKTPTLTHPHPIFTQQQANDEQPQPQQQPSLPSTCHTVALPPDEAAAVIATYPPYSPEELQEAKRVQLIPGEVLYCEVRYSLFVCVCFFCGCGCGFRADASG